MIPNYVPQSVAPQWQAIYNQYALPEMGLVMANKWLSQNAVVAEPIKRSKDTLVPLKFAVTGETLISRSSSGEEYITAVLSDDQPYYTPEGTVERFTPDVLRKFAETINREMPVGDMDHAFYDAVLNSNLTDEQIKRALKTKPGIAKAVRAVVDKGKLYLRLLIDKRYRKVVEKAKGLSIEALVSKDPTGTVRDGSLLGFTFAVDHTPVNQRAVILG